MAIQRTVNTYVGWFEDAIGESSKKDDTCSDNTYMGQFPQDGENVRRMSFFPTFCPNQKMTSLDFR